jgi:signal transduction histidine kinase
VNFIEIEVDRIGKKISIEKDLNEEHPIYIKADPEKIQQIIINLCLNAVQAMPEGGLLSVSCMQSKGKNKKYITFSITDTGIGIEKERRNKIFDPFHTSKENGTGLGLAIVKKIVDHHSGYINLKSKVNEGTAIHVFLPQMKDER